MTFLVLLLAYIIRRRFDAVNRLDVDVLWRRFFRWGARVPAGKESRIWPGVLIVVTPALMLIYASHALRSLSPAFLDQLLDLVLLIGLLGMVGWKGRLTAYSEAWQRGDMQAAWHHVKDFLPADRRGSASAPESLHLELSARFMQTMFERYFLIMFWYLVGGIGVAFAVRGVLALRDHWPQAAARPGFSVAANGLSWLPVRLLSMSFGLAGDLAGWLREGLPRVLPLRSNPESVLLGAANAALTGYALEPGRFGSLHPDGWAEFGDKSLRAIRDLLNRSMFVWIGILALLVIAGILS